MAHSSKYGIFLHKWHISPKMVHSFINGTFLQMWVFSSPWNSGSNEWWLNLWLQKFWAQKTAWYQFLLEGHQIARLSRFWQVWQSRRYSSEIHQNIDVEIGSDSRFYFFVQFLFHPSLFLKRTFSFFSQIHLISSWRLTTHPWKQKVQASTL